MPLIRMPMLLHKQSGKSHTYIAEHENKPVLLECERMFASNKRVWHEFLRNNGNNGGKYNV